MTFARPLQKRFLKKNTAVINPADRIQLHGRINFFLRQKTVPNRMQAIIEESAADGRLTPVSKQLMKHITVPAAPAAATAVLKGRSRPVRDLYGDE